MIFVGNPARPSLALPIRQHKFVFSNGGRTLRYAHLHFRRGTSRKVRGVLHGLHSDSSSQTPSGRRQSSVLSRSYTLKEMGQMEQLLTAWASRKTNSSFCKWGYDRHVSGRCSYTRQRFP